MSGDSQKLLELAARVIKKTVNQKGCLIFTGSKNDRGYGQIWDGVRSKYTHRVVFEAKHGAIPTGMQIDHLCRVRDCCNVDHLELVTPKENVRRGLAGLHRKIECSMITECPRGHLYSQENTYVSRLGKRHCKACAIIRQRATREKHRASISS